MILTPKIIPKIIPKVFYLSEDHPLFLTVSSTPSVAEPIEVGTETLTVGTEPLELGP